MNTDSLLLLLFSHSVVMPVLLLDSFRSESLSSFIGFNALLVNAVKYVEDSLSLNGCGEREKC